MQRHIPREEYPRILRHFRDIAVHHRFARGLGIDCGKMGFGNQLFYHLCGPAGINQIINQQLPDEEKNERADFSIKNTDNKLLLPQVIALHEQLLRKAETNE